MFKFDNENPGGKICVIFVAIPKYVFRAQSKSRVFCDSCDFHGVR